jgi:hypothetical protein
MAIWPEDDEPVRRAVERLLAWGFAPQSIAQQLHCSQDFVEAVRAGREMVGTDLDERAIASDVLGNPRR